ncbi:MAG: Short-chain dehydrogenase [Rhodoglobus sp.]|nr:Short-chain dehydrogenase [Rhodoglobus sp.]
MPIALITGASAGLGAEFARQLASRGYDLVLVARDRARLDALALTLPVRVEVMAADLLDAASRALVEARLAATERPVDYLVNNAGFGLATEFDESTVEEESAQLELLATVPLRLAHAALSQMLPRHSGRILTVASVAGFAGLGAYSAAKSWAITFSRWANAYYRSSGVTVTALAPGFVRTEFHERMGVTRESMAPRAAWLDADRVVRAALRDVDRRRPVSIPSARYRALIGVLPLLGPAIRAGVARRGTAARS